MEEFAGRDQVDVIRDREVLQQSKPATVTVSTTQNNHADKSQTQSKPPIPRQALDVQLLNRQQRAELSTSDTEQESESASDRDRESFHPFYENFDLTVSGAYQHFTLPRPQVRSLPSWAGDSEDHYNNIGGSITSSAELLSDNSPAASPTSSIPNQSDFDTDTMNNYPYQGSNNGIYHNLYGYSTSSRASSSTRDDVPYSSIKNNSRLKKIRSDNVSPAVSNTTASTGLSSARGTMKRQQKSQSGSGDYGHGHGPSSNGTGTIPRPAGVMSRSARAANASAIYYSTPGPVPDHIVVPVPVQACQGSPYCSGCSGQMQLQPPGTHLETIPEMCSLKTDPTLYWNYTGNNNNVHIPHPLKRNFSIGGFTLNGQPRLIKKSKMSRFCSSHKIALVVSTFSMLVTLGLVVTLILMKKKGMMEAM